MLGWRSKVPFMLRVGAKNVQYPLFHPSQLPFKVMVY